MNMTYHSVRRGLPRDLEDVVVRYSQSVLMKIGVEPPKPNLIPEYLLKHLVQKNLLEQEYYMIARKIINTYKKIEHGDMYQTYDIEVDNKNHNFETVAGVVSNSETAMWPAHTDELLTSLFQCIPRPPADTEVWIESTGKGYGNWFQRKVFETYAEGKHGYFNALISD